MTDEQSSDDSNWREGIGKLSDGEAEELEKTVLQSRAATSEGLARSQRAVLDRLESDDSD
ncbi:MAG: hypothetical protein ABEI75_00400 [Halobaculum sp.]